MCFYDKVHIKTRLFNIVMKEASLSLSMINISKKNAYFFQLIHTLSVKRKQ